MLQRFRKVIKYSRHLWTMSESESNICLKNDSENLALIKFPYVWLRDNCQCEKCFHGPSNSRTIHLPEFNFDAAPKETKITDDKLLEVEWNDDHKSTYHISWLMERQFKSDVQNDWKNKVYRDKRIPWTAKDLPKILKKYSYKNIMERDDELLSWLETLAVYGMATIRDAGSIEGKVQELAERISFLRRTQYGTTFQVVAKPGTTNVAYLSGPLPLHTDLPYCHYTPGVNTVHCIEQASEGGDSILVDFLAVAEWLKEHDYRIYSVLRDTNIVWSDKCIEDGKPYHSIYLAPVICENSLGEIERINLSQPQRDSQFFGSIEEAKEWYKGLKIISDMVYSPEYLCTFKMEPGEIFTFDNLRILHGRVLYSGARFLEGAYLDWDLIYSKIRVLRSKNH